MRREQILRQIGLAGGGFEPRLVWGVILTVLALYLVSFACFPPTIATNEDEARYIRQARLLLEGTMNVPRIHPLSGQSVETQDEADRYPLGTALLMAPFIWALGERGAWLSALVAVVLGVLVTARWIADERRSPLWALLLMGFPAALAVGRLALSDGPSLATAAVGLWLFWRGLDRGWGWWLASGFMAGASLALRESNPLIFITFYAGTVLRRELRCIALVCGGLLGMSVRLVSSWLAFGDPFYSRGVGPNAFGLHAIPENLALHSLGLLVLVPGGLFFALAYRGRRRPEVVGGIALFVLFYLLHSFGPGASGFSKRLVIELRYFVPLLPLLAFAMAESVPRLWQRLLEGRPRSWRGVLEATAAALVVLWVAGVASASVAVHGVLGTWSRSQAVIRDEIHRVTGEGVLVTNIWATKKFTRQLDRPFAVLDRDEVTAEDAAALAQRHDQFFIAFLDRSDAKYWEEDRRKNAAFVASIQPPPILELDRQATSTDRLRIWRVSRLDRGNGDGARREHAAPAGSSPERDR
jgi:hypothetical protein